MALMPATRPHSVADLALAPVAINIERNIAELRSSDDLEFALALELNDDSSWYHDRVQRAWRIARAVTRGVELHGWQACPAPDMQGLLLEHGEYQVTLMFGKKLDRYIELGAASRAVIETP